MKKIILVFIILCTAGQMYGMEIENPKLGGMANLPKDVQVLVIQALNSGQDIDATISAIIRMGQTNKAFNEMVNNVYIKNLKGFTALVGLLAKKFPNKNRHEIAKKFNTPIAQEYIQLGDQFKDILSNLYDEQSEGPKALIQLKELIDKGLDINYVPKNAQGESLLEILYRAAEDDKTQMATLKLLLDTQQADTTDLTELIEKAQREANFFAHIKKPTPEKVELLNLLKKYAK